MAITPPSLLVQMTVGDSHPINVGTIDVTLNTTDRSNVVEVNMSTNDINLNMKKIAASLDQRHVV
jgi:hypothetical protein